MEVMRFKDAAAFLRVPETTLRTRWRAWGVPASKVGKSVLFTKSALEQWLRQQEQGIGDANISQ